MSKWRRHPKHPRVQVLCDQLAEAGLWPFIRYPWRPDLRFGFGALRIGGIQIVPHEMCSDDRFYLLSPGAPPVVMVTSEISAGVIIHAAMLQQAPTAQVFVSLRGMATLNIEAARARQYDVTYGPLTEALGRQDAQDAEP